MKMRFHSLTPLLGAAFLLALALSPKEALSQVNDQKILREASGVYKGQRTGGIATFSGAADPVANPPFSVTPPTYKGKFKLSAASKKPKILLNAPGQLPGNGKATYKGKRKKAKVSPNGRKIAYQVVKGTGVEDDGQPAYTGGAVGGTFAKKGSKWTTKLKMSATQRNRTDTFPTVAVRNLKVKAKR